MTRSLKGNTGTPLDSIVVHRREYIQDINGSVGFVATLLSDNPGLPALHPWLSSIAPNYEEYEVISKSFVFETESPTSTTGVVVLCYDYDALDASPANKASALQYSDNIRSAPWVRSVLSLRSDDLRKRGCLYVRTGPVASSDLKTYDLGNLIVCTSGQANTNIIGELWVDYTIRLRVPQPVDTTSVALSQHVRSSAPTTASPFASPITSSGSSAIVSISGSVLTFLLGGRFLVSSSIYATTVTLPSPPVVALGGSLLTTFGRGTGAPAGYTYTGGTSDLASAQIYLSAQVGTTLTLSQVVTSGVGSELVITTLPPNQT